MNPIVVAQANGPQSGNSSPKVITVNKPQGEQAITIHLDGSTKLDLSAIANEQITLVHVGDRLIILFDNHAQVTVEPFYASDNNQPLADLTIELGPGRDITAAQFASQFPITDDPSVLPASGGPNAPSSGANFVSFTLDTLSTPGPLDLLGPETFGSNFGPLDEAPGNTPIVPMSLTNAVINGGVDEGGMVTDTIHTVGNDPGAAFAATGVAGSLNALVNFGTGGPNGHPFQFVTTAAADTWFAHLGLESHGSLIDTATISGNTLTASTDPAQGTPHDVFSLTINDDGSWVFTLLAPLDHVTGQGENTALLDLSGLIQAVDAAGVHLTLANDFKITVVDDVPVEIAGAVASGSVDEGALYGPQSPGDLFGDGNDHGVSGALSFVSGTLSGLVAFGADGPATVTFGSGEGEGHETVTDGFQFAVATGVHDFGVTSHGLEVGFITVTSFGTTEILTAFTGNAPGGNEVFSLLLEGDGSYSFALINPIDHPASGEDSVTLDLSSLIKAIDFDGDAVTLSGDFKITIVDDVPVLVSGASPSLASVDEGALFHSTTLGDLYGDGNDHGVSGDIAVASGSLAGQVSFGADGPALIGTGKDGFQLAVTTGAHDFGIKSHGNEVNFLTVATSGATETLTAYTGGSAGGTEVFTLVLNGDGTYTFTLVNPIDHSAAGEDSTTLDLSSLIKAIDFDGDSVALSGDFKITIVDDIPVLVSGASASTGFVDEGGLDQKSFHGGTDLYGEGNDPYAPTVASGTLAGLARFGADGAESGTFTATFTDSHYHTQSLTQTIADGFHFVGAAAAEAWLTGLNGGQGVSSHGEEINFVAVTSATSTNGTTVSDVETLAAWTDGGPSHGGHEVFTLSLNVTTGAWTFTLINPIDHAVAGEDITKLDLSGLVQAVDFDHDAVTLVAGDLTVSVKDDVPVLDCDDNSYGKVDEGALHLAGSGSPGDLYGDGNDQGFCDFATSTACGSLDDLVAFGADGPAAKAFQFVSQAAAQAWITSLGLKSHGDLIDTASISTDSHGNLVLTAGTDQGDHHSVFTLTLDQDNGQWLFTLLNPLDQATDNGENAKSIDLSGLIQAVDFDGDTVTLANDFSITVVDDVPELTCVNSSGSVDEGALVSSSFLGDLYGSGNDAAMSAASVTVTGGLSGLVAFGADGPNATADYRFVSQSAASHWLGNLNLSSHGSDVDNVSIVNQGGGLFLLTAIADDGHKVFTLQLDQATGAWTFTLLNPIDHVPGHGENSTTLDLSGLIQAVDFDGDAVTLSNDFTVKIVDDVPVRISGTSSGSVDEGGLNGSTHGGDLFGSGNDHGSAITATGTLSGLVAFGADGPDTSTSTSNHHTVTINTGFQFVSEHTAESWLASLNNGHGLTSHGETIDEVDVSVVNGIATLTASTDDHDGFTLQLNETTGAWTFTLINPIDHPAGNTENTVTVDLSGLVQGVDFDGDAVTLSGDFSVTVTDDVPVQVGNKSSSGAVDEGGLTSGSLGDLYGSGTGHGAITASGSLAQLVSFGADGAQSGTFSATFTDSHHHSQTVTDTIADGFQFVSASAAGTWLAGLNLNSHGQAINFATMTPATSTDGHDVSDVLTLTAWTNGGSSHGGHEVFTLTLDVSTGAWTFTLINPIDDATGNGQNSATLDLSGLVQAVDFDHDAITLSGHFSVTVIDDVPSASHVSATVSENAASASVTLVAGHDYSFGADGPGTVTFDTQHAVITGPNGVTLGAPSYVVNGNSLEIDLGTAFQHLGAGQSATIDISYTVTDFDGDTATNDIKVEVDGVNQRPVITSAAESIAVTEGESYTPPANLITNGGFETWSYNSQTNSYSIPGWSSSNFLYPPGVSGVAHSGSAAGDVATFPSTNLGTLSQTVTDEAGELYKIDFWALPTNGFGVVSTDNTISVSWDGMTVLAQSNVPSITTTNPTSASQYVEYTAQVVGTGSDLFAITLGTDYYWFIDDVSVKAVTTPGVEKRQGTITFTDADTSDTHTVTVTPDGAGYHGTFNAVIGIGTDSTGGHTGTVAWTYTVNDSDLTFLASGQTTTQTYTVTISDGHSGGTISQDVSVTLTGGGAAALAFALDPASDTNSAINETSSNHLSSGDVIGTFSAVGDPNPDTFTYSFASGTHTDLSLNSTTGVLSVSSNMTNLTDTFTVSASDGHDPAVTTTVTVWAGTQNGDVKSFATNTSDILVAYGLGGNDTITGESGTGTTSILVGGGGTDTLIAGGGSNVLVGGSGNDTFVFNAPPPSGHGNTISDFWSGNDRINVSAAGFGGIFSGENTATIFESSSSNSFASSTSRFHFDTANHGLYFSADGTTGHEVLLATITNSSAAASDIHVVA